MKKELKAEVKLDRHGQIVTVGMADATRGKIALTPASQTFDYEELESIRDAIESVMEIINDNDLLS